jgi:molybdopterin converting factor small subunit
VPIIFHIPGALREFTAGHSTVEIELSPATLAEALTALWTIYPGVRDRIATEQGQVRQHINIFIGDENVRYTGGLASPVSAGAEISIVPAVSGGGESSRVAQPACSLELFRSAGNGEAFHR